MIGVRDELTERVRIRLEQESGIRMEWSLDLSGEGIQGLRVSGSEPRHGFLIALSRNLHRVEAALVAETYAGRLLRSIGENISSDASEWIALEDQAASLGVKSLLHVNGEAQIEMSSLPLEPWRSLELECACRVPQGESAEEKLALAAATCLSFLLSGVRGTGRMSEEPIGRTEGSAYSVEVTRFERDPANRLRCIQYYGRTCWVCDFDFSVSYGALGEGYIVVHHTLPVSKMGPDYRVDPLAELVPLCANCHAMVHRTDPPVPPEVLRESLGKPAKPPRPTKAPSSIAVAGGSGH